MFSNISQGRLISPAFIFLSMIDFTPSYVVVGIAALPNGLMMGAYALAELLAHGNQDVAPDVAERHAHEQVDTVRPDPVQYPVGNREVVRRPRLARAHRAIGEVPAVVGLAHVPLLPFREAKRRHTARTVPM